MKKAKLLLVSMLLLFSISCSKKEASDSFEKSPMYWGLFMQRLQSNENRLENLKQEYSTDPSIIMWFIDWQYDFPDVSCDIVDQSGAVPCIVWEPWIVGRMNSITLTDIVSGKWDEYISKWGEQAGEYNKSVMVRWGHEMNGNWYPWCGPLNGNSPELYIQAYRHVHDLATEAGGENIIWLWSPNCDSVPDEEFNKASEYYPGDEYVDWVAIDGYNWGTSQSFGSWRTFDEIFGSALQEASVYAPEKPVMIGEMGCSSQGGDKGVWMAEFFESVKRHYPQLHAWIWFNMNKETDWAFSNNDELKVIFNNGVSDPDYSENIKRLKKYHKRFHPGD